MTNNDTEHPSPTLSRVDVHEAAALIERAMPVFPARRVALAEATGLILAEGIHAERDQPPFDRATMDGIAISAAALTESADSPPGARFRLLGTQAAGAPPLTLHSPTECVEIMTGAVMPVGADTVIPVERVQRDGEYFRIASDYRAEPGQYVHRRASDHHEGDLLLQPGTRIGAPEMAILTAAGQPDVAVANWPSVAIVSTGDELVDVGEPITPQQIRSSNDRAIEASLKLHGCQRSVRCRLPDDEAALLSQIRSLHHEHDVLILSGGVSMGKYDYIPKVLETLDVDVVFHKVLQRPGLPMWFGRSRQGVPVFALPGNPVSTLVCLTRYVLPALQQALGRTPVKRTLRLGEAVKFSPDLCWFLPVAIDHGPDGPLALPRPTNTSGDFIGLRGTEGFIELPRGLDHFAAGESFRFWPWQAW